DFGAYFAANIREWKLGGRGDQGVGFCPFPEHEDKQKSFSGNALNGLWNCKGCGRKGDYFTLWAFFNNRSIQSEFKDILAAIADEIGIRGSSSGGGVGGGDRRPAAPPRPKPPPPPPADPIPELIWRVLRKDMTPDLRRELAKLRGLEEETLERFDIGWDKVRRRYAIPVRDEKGVLRNIRLYSAVYEPKMLNWWHWECPECKLFFREVIKGKERTNFCPKCSKELPKSAYKSFGEARLYPLDEFAKQDYREFLFCEGEFDCLMLWERGMQALTGTGGAGTFKREWLETFAGRRPVLILDCDPPGIEQATKHAQAMLRDGRVPGLKVVRLPLSGTKQEKDITDWFRLGRTSMELIKVIKDAKTIEPPKKEGKAASADDFISYHIVARAFMKTPYCQRDCVCTLRSWREEFYLWTGRIYKKQMKSDVKLRICGFLENYPALLAKKSLTGLMNDITNAVSQELMIPFDLEPPMLFNAQEGRFDKVNEILSFDNGLLDLQQAMGGKTLLMKHSPNYFILKGLPYNYDPNATCPSWLEYLNYCWPDETLRKCLQEFAGLCLTPDIKYQRFMILLGEGGTGKSTFINAVVGMLGRDNVSACSLHQLGEQFGLAPLIGKNLNIAGEVQDIDVKGEGILKQIAGGDTVEIDRKYKDTLNLVLTTRMIFAANQVPKFADKSAGLWRKLLLIPCEVVIPPDKRDMDLAKKIQSEMPGVFNWALEGLKNLQARKDFLETPMMADFKEDARSDMNPVRTFLSDFTSIVNGKTTPCLMLYTKYIEWCKSNGNKWLNEIHFGRELARYHQNKTNRVRNTVGGKREYFYENLIYLDEFTSEPRDDF
ncbi:MAG: hypothetical protein KKE01_07955, partial [Candidatus Omnitrophica bacterium]|nr:hypothetical protein [Candidatus Omnitrophota bacterium]